MKVGDKLICKKDFDTYFLKKNKEYIIYRIDYDFILNKPVMFYNVSCNKYTYSFEYLDIICFFYLPNELRLKKLESL